jgi:transcriptional regulator with XRE-family HTH domain
LIRERREQLGMSRHELAEATAVPYPTIAQIETAYRGSSPSRLGVIARALDLDPADLYEVLTSDAASPSAAPAQHSRSSMRSTGGGDWQPNPAYDPLSAPLPEESHRHPADVVEHVVDLLSQLPRTPRPPRPGPEPATQTPGPRRRMTGYPPAPGRLRGRGGHFPARGRKAGGPPVPCAQS